MKQWYAVRTKARTEARVAATLEDKGFETMLPVISRDQRDTGVRRPLFPTYLFLYIDLSAASPSRWRRVPGLHYLVGYGGKPVAIPDHVIRTVAHTMVGPHGRPEHDFLKFQPGDMVRIKDGPFQDLMGVFEARLSSNERVQILLQAMQRSIRVQVSADSLEKVADKGNRIKKKRPRRTRGKGRPIRRS